jgi:polysaccharide biosynthesis transport protein
MSREMLSPSSEESLVARAFAIIRRRAVVAVIGFATVFAAAVAFALYLPDLYRASAIVLIERPLAESVVRPTVSNELESRLYVIKQEILSRDRLTELVKRFNLYPELRKKASFEDVLNQARQDIQWEPNGPEQVSGRAKTVTFTLTYTGDERKTVADVTNAVATFFVAHNSGMRTDEARRATLFLEDQLKAAQKQVDEQESRLRSYTLAHQSQLPQSVGASLATISQMMDDLRRNRDDQRSLVEQRERLIAVADEAAALTAAATPSSAAPGDEQIPPSKELNELRDQLAKAKETLIEYERKGLRADHPDVKNAKEQIASLEKAVDEQRGRDVAAFKAKEQAEAERRAATGQPELPKAMPRSRRTIKDVDQELDRLKKEETDMRAAVAGLQQRFDSLPAVQQEFMLIQRDYQSAKESYDVLQRRYDEAKVAESVEAGHQGENFRVLESAIVPEGPSAPNRLRLIIMGLLLALAAGAAAVVVAEQFDTSFHTVDELREFTGIPVLATIPQIGAAPRRGYMRTALGTASALAVIVLVGTLSAYIANGNETLVRMLQRAG